MGRRCQSGSGIASPKGNPRGMFGLREEKAGVRQGREKAIFSFEERRQILESLLFVSEIKKYNGPTPIGSDPLNNSFEKEVWDIERRKPCPNLFIKGADYTMETLDQKQVEILKKYGFTICFLEYEKEYSTSKMINDLITKKGPAKAS